MDIVSVNLHYFLKFLFFVIYYSILVYFHTNTVTDEVIQCSKVYFVYMLMTSVTFSFLSSTVNCQPKHIPEPLPVTSRLVSDFIQSCTSLSGTATNIPSTFLYLQTVHIWSADHVLISMEHLIVITINPWVNCPVGGRGCKGHHLVQEEKPSPVIIPCFLLTC